MFRKILNIENKCFKDPWNEDMIISSLNSKFDKNILIEDFAYINYRIIYDEAELMRIAVLPEYRNKKMASKLMDIFISDLKKNHIKKCFLEIRKSNTAAMNLYKKYNFELIAARKNYYSNPVEDALIMLLNLERDV